MIPTTRQLALGAACVFAAFLIRRWVVWLLQSGKRKEWLAQANRGHAEALARAELQWSRFDPGRDTAGLSPRLSPLQVETSRRTQQDIADGRVPSAPAVCVVTGGTGFVGTRLVEMLVERGARRVVCFDVVPPHKDAWRHPAIEYVEASITDYEAVKKAVAGADCVWHLAAAVGPFHSQAVYEAVNVQGSLNVLRACREQNVRKIVMSSSPSTRLTAAGCDGLAVSEMPTIPMPHYLQGYAETKARAEHALAQATDVMTVAVAPHQVYGPRDSLFLNAFVEASITGRLRVFSRESTGFGFNRVSFTHVDNYAHALILAERQLTAGSPALGKFYIATDSSTHPFSDGYTFAWVALDQATRFLGLGSLLAKAALPDWLLFPLAFLGDRFTQLTGIHVKLKVFNVRLMTMHRWFRTEETKKDLRYEPLVPYSAGWADTLVWFRQVWMPEHMSSGNVHALTGLAVSTGKRISVHEKAVLGKKD